jgi:hypothetical protein
MPQFIGKSGESQVVVPPVVPQLLQLGPLRSSRSPGSPRLPCASHHWVEMGDQLLWYKYVAKDVARRHGRTMTFMPKPLSGDNGSGMH